MSLEDALNRNSDLLEKSIALQEKALAIVSSKVGAPAEAEAKPKATKADKGTKAPSVEEARGVLKGKITAWMTEFPDKDPETDDRGNRLKAAFAKIGVENIGGVNTQELVDRTQAWLDKQLAKGRVQPPWTPDEAAGGDDEDI